MLKLRTTVLVALVLLSTNSLQASHMIITEKDKPNEYEPYRNSFHFNAFGMLSLVVHQDMCQLDLANESHREIRNLEFERLRESQDVFIAYFFPCDHLVALNATNFQNFDRLKVYQFDATTATPDVDLRVNLLAMGDDSGNVVSTEQAAYLTGALGLKGSLVEGHEIRRKWDGDVQLGFPLRKRLSLRRTN